MTLFALLAVDNVEKLVLVHIWANINSDLYEMHLPLSEEVIGVAVVADMEPTDFDSFLDKRLAFTYLCSNRPEMVGHSHFLA